MRPLLIIALLAVVGCTAFEPSYESNSSSWDQRKRLSLAEQNPWYYCAHRGVWKGCD